MHSCRACNGPAYTHINHGMMIDRMPGKMSGWYCDNHKHLPAIEKERLVKAREAQ